MTDHRRFWLGGTVLAAILCLVFVIGCAQTQPAPTPATKAQPAPTQAAQAQPAPTQAAQAKPAPTQAAQAQPAKPSAYVIGSTFPLTGASALYGAMAKSAADLAVKTINDSGGVGGVPLQVFHEDGRLDVKPSVEAFQKLIDVQKVPVIFSVGSSVLLAQYPIAQERKVIIANIAGQSPRLKQLGDWLFSFIPDSDQEATALADVMVNKLKAKTAAVIFADGDYGQDSATAFQKAVEAKGGKVVATEKYPTGAQDMRTQLIKLKAANADVLMPFANQGEGGYVVKQAREQGFTGNLLGTSQINVPANIKIAGDAMNGLVGVDMPFKPDANAEAKAFAQAYKQAYQRDATVYDALSFDGVRVVAEALKSAGGNSDAIRKYLLTVKDFKATLGSLTISSDRVAGFPMRVYKVANQQVVDY